MKSDWKFLKFRDSGLSMVPYIEVIPENVGSSIPAQTLLPIREVTLDSPLNKLYLRSRFFAKTTVSET